MLKKLICLLVAVVLCLPIYAAAEDFSAMSTEELQTLIDQARAELLNRELAMAEKTVIVEADGITVTLTGEVDLEAAYDDTMTLKLNVIVTNTSDKDMAACLDSVYVNGWEGWGFSSFELAAGKKAKDTIEVYEVDVDAELTALEELETIEFHFYTYDPNSYETVTDDIVTTVHF
ncbi:MAG: hypothetical protein PUK18_01920 [Firmicutes bacterium]|nr:hypothetical protein [Bacillota bacterium]MDY6159511.1 hypothetical protein [Candidatus Faecousia sp.]